MDLLDTTITTEILLTGALLFAGMDAVFISLLVWRIRPALFRKLKCDILAATALFWTALWFTMVQVFWESVYRYVFPTWSRWYIPFFMALLTCLVSVLAWWLSRRMPGHPFLAFVIMAGLWGMLSHIHAVSLGIVSRPPMLQGASPVAAVIIAIFEFVFYWCIILLLAVLIHKLNQLRI